MKKIILLAVTSALLLTAVACTSTGASQSTAASTSQSENVESSQNTAEESSQSVAEQTEEDSMSNEDFKFISAEDAKALIDSGEDVVVFGVLDGTKALVPLMDENSPIDGTFRVWRSDYSGSGSSEAISTNVSGFRTGLDSMNELMSKAGVTEDSTIIVYSTGSMHDSTRFGWQLELIGLEPLYLDGGLNAWKDAGFETGKQVTLADEEVKTDFASTEWNVDELSADISDVIAALENPEEWVVIDTRSEGEYNGEKTGSSSGAFGTGAMTGAVHIEWTNAVNEDKTLKSAEELEAIYGDVIDGKKVITFCQSGVRSSHTMMVLREMLGVEDVYNYDGSWIEWSYAASQSSEDVDAELRESVLALTDKWTDNNGKI